MIHLIAWVSIFILTGCASTSTIHTSPLDADVYINGHHCRISPCIYHSRYGYPDRMRLQIRAPGYHSAEFFVDTEAPMASYLLLGFGSYVLHGFDKEYRFKLRPLADLETRTASRKDLGFKGNLQDGELASILEQCLYWGEQKSRDVWKTRFYKRAEALDCRIAESSLSSQSKKKDSPKPALARALIRYTAYRRQNNIPTINLPWTTKFICRSAVVEYAKRAGASTPPATPAFDKFCPEESKQLRDE